MVSGGRMGYEGVSIIPKTIRLLMGAVSDDVEFDRIVQALGEIAGVKAIHHVHVWSLHEHQSALEAHLEPEDGALERFEKVEVRVRQM